MKKFIFILLCVVFCFSLSGCDYTEIDTKTIVAGISVDSDESGKLKTTFEVISPASEESNFSSILVTGFGSTIKGSIQKGSILSEKKLDVTHAQIAILGESLCKSGIATIANQFFSDEELRVNMSLLVAKESDSYSIISSKLGDDPIVSFHIRSNFQKESVKALVPEGALYQFLRTSTTKGKEIVLPTIVSQKNGEDDVVFSDGLAIFKEDRLAGYADLNESLIYMLIMGEGENSQIEFEVDGTPMVIKISDCKSKLRCKTDQSSNPLGTLDMKIQFDVLSDVGESNLLLPEDIKKVEQAAAEQINVRIFDFYKKTQSLKSDIFGFGDKLNVYDEKYFASLSDKWSDEIYPFLPLSLNLSVSLASGGQNFK